MPAMVKELSTCQTRLNTFRSAVAWLAILCLVLTQSACVSRISPAQGVADQCWIGVEHKEARNVQLIAPVIIADPIAPHLERIPDTDEDPTQTSVEECYSPLVMLDDVAVGGVSPVGMAFVFAWYGDIFRLFKLLPALEARHVDIQDLRWGWECMIFTSDETAPDFTLVHVAAVRGNDVLVRKLVDYGLPVDDRGARGLSPSPLELLLDRDGRSFGTSWPDRKTLNQMVALLLELGAKPMSRGILLPPIIAEDGILLEMLLRAGADPNRPMYAARLPLFAALDSPELVRILLRYGANPHATNSMGMTIFDFVRIYPGLGQVLEEANVERRAPAEAIAPDQSR